MNQEELEAQAREGTALLIDTLKQQHQELMWLIGQVGVALELGEKEGVLTALSSLCQALQAHVALEDQRLYPSLACAAETSEDSSMLETAYLFSSNMHRIIESLRDLLSRHQASFHMEQFRTYWNTLGPVLIRRLEAEERTLYPLHERSDSSSLSSFKNWLRLMSNRLLMASMRLTNSCEERPRRFWRRCFVSS